MDSGDVPSPREALDAAWDEWLLFNEDATKKGSGFTRDQMNGAAGFLSFLRDRATLAASPAPTDEERAAFKRSEYEAMRRIIATPAPAPLDVEALRQATINSGYAIQVVAGNIDATASFDELATEYARLTGRAAATEDTDAQ